MEELGGGGGESGVLNRGTAGAPGSPLPLAQLLLARTCPFPSTSAPSSLPRRSASHPRPELLLPAVDPARPLPFPKPPRPRVPEPRRCRCHHSCPVCPLSDVARLHTRHPGTVQLYSGEGPHSAIGEPKPWRRGGGGGLCSEPGGCSPPLPHLGPVLTVIPWGRGAEPPCPNLPLRTQVPPSIL